MATECLIMMKFGSETVAIDVVPGFSYKNLVSSCLGRWKQISPDSVGFKYSIEGHPNCFLTCQDDLVAMLKLFKLLKKPLINIEVAVQDHPKECNVGSNVVIDKRQPSLSNVGNSVSDHVVKDFNVVSDVVVDKGQPVSNSASDQFVGSSSADLSLDVVNVDDEDDDDEEEEENGMVRATPCQGNEELLSLGWSTCISHVGQGFHGGAVKFRIELCKYALFKGFKYDFARNNKERVTANCSKRKSEGCFWSVVASQSVVNKNWFYIKKLNNVHTCSPSPNFDKSTLLSTSMTADLIVEEIKANPTASARFVKEVFMKNYGLVMSYSKCWRALEAARSLIFGRLEESFQELKWYCEAIRRKNVGSFVDLNVDPTTKRFKRMFVAFGASISGYSHCRPVLFVGRTILKSRYKGTLLVATGKDAEDDLYPLAFAVVDAENEDNWLWFMRHLRTILDPDRRITIISNTACGLVDAIPAVLGESTDHFYCLEHLKENLRSQFSSQGVVSKHREMFVDMFSDCAHASSVASFSVKVAALSEEGGEAVETYVSSLPIDKWNNAHGPRNRYGEMYSNPAEFINSWVSDVKGLPIMYVFETIRVKLLGWFNERITKSISWNSWLCPKKAELLTSHINNASTWNVERSIGNVYNVFSYLSVTVNLDLHTCTCELWQVYGFPCVHAVAAVRRCDKDVADIVESFFHVSSYKSCYAGTIASIPSRLKQEFIQQIEDGEILPPEKRKKAGQYKKRKKKSGGENSCKASKCDCTDGHDSASCAEAVRTIEVSLVECNSEAATTEEVALVEFDSEAAKTNEVSLIEVNSEGAKRKEVSLMEVDLEAVATKEISVMEVNSEAVKTKGVSLMEVSSEAAKPKVVVSLLEFNPEAAKRDPFLGN